MKKFLLVIVALAILAAAAWYLLRGFLSADSALYLPENTVAYVALTDTLRTSQRWQETDLARIAKEPAIRDFLQKPLEKLGRMGKTEAEEILYGLKPLRIFWAVTSVEITHVSWVGGFQYYGGPKELQHSLARLRAQLDLGVAASPPPIVTTYQGVEITQTLHRKLSLFTATTGHWCVITGDEKGMHDFIDRMAGRVKTPSLAKSADFLAGLTHLPKEPDMVALVQVQPLLDALLKTGQSLGARPNPSQLESAQRVKALYAAFKIDGRVMRDSIYIETAQSPSEKDLAHDTVQYTSPDTLAYYTAAAQWPNIKDLITSGAPIPPDISRNLVEQHLDTVNLAHVFAPEFGLVLSWPATNFRPEALIAIPLLDADTAKKIVETVSATMFPQMVVSTDDYGTYYSYPSVSNPLLNPTIAITKNALLAGIAETEVRSAATKNSPSEDITRSADFESVRKVYQDSNQAFAYLDSKALFERGYAALRPVLTFGAAMLPQVNEYVDVEKLPDPALVSKHLTPIIYSQRRVPGGISIESYGPLTFNQLVLIGGGTGWMFMPKH